MSGLHCLCCIASVAIVMEERRMVCADPTGTAAPASAPAPPAVGTLRWIEHQVLKLRATGIEVMPHQFVLNCVDSMINA
jgi:hypothetical protein